MHNNYAYFLNLTEAGVWHWTWYIWCTGMAWVLHATAAKVCKFTLPFGSCMGVAVRGPLTSKTGDFSGVSGNEVSTSVRMWLELLASHRI